MPITSEMLRSAAIAGFLALANASSGDGDPLNVLRWNPSQGRYAPLWDVHLAQWAAAAVAAGRNVRQTDWARFKGWSMMG
jgi:hypothetical protein